MLIVFLALGLYASIDLAIRARTPEPESLVDRLPVELAEGDVYLLGNSMFKTGIDIDQLATMLPDESVKFSYHDGYYTNLWYLMVKNAFVPAVQRPSLLVWGFRPTYAIQPAFQKIDSPDIEMFRLDEEPFWDEVVSSRGSVELNTGRGIMDEIGQLSTIHSGRETAQEWIQQEMNILTVGALDTLGTSYAGVLREGLVDGDDAVSDVLLRTLTEGRVQMSEELVVDDGDRFITGPQVPFEQSFVPHTADLLQEAGIPQLVLIFKPVAAAQGNLDPEAAAFAEAATRYFDARGIPYINFLAEPSVVLEHFAKGDHYNEAGRENLTRLIGERILQLLETR